MRRAIRFLLCFARAIGDDELALRAAALAYYATFSIFPLLLLIVSSASFLLHDEALLAAMIEAIGRLFPGGGEMILRVVEGVIAARGAVQIVGLAGLLWSASAFFSVLEATINRVFGVSAVRPAWRSRGLGLLMAALVGPLLLLSVALSALSTAVTRWAPLPPVVLDLVRAGVNQGLLLVVMALAFTLLYRFVPVQRPALRPTLASALLAALAWAAVTYGFTWYLSSDFATFNLVYGPISAVIALILWFFLSNFIILLGAELAALISRVKPCQPPELPGMLQKILGQ